jgi:hypothetical protein
VRAPDKPGSCPPGHEPAWCALARADRAHRRLCPGSQAPPCRRS